MSREEKMMCDILNCTKRQIVSYFGEPVLDFPSLVVFVKSGKYFAVSFKSGKSSALVLYDIEGAVRYTSEQVICSSTEKLQEWENHSYSDFVNKYGIPHFDFGSGRTIPGYFVANGIICSLQVLNNTIRQIGFVDLKNMNNNKEDNANV